MGKSKENPKPWIWITGNYYDCRKKWKELLVEMGDPYVETLDCGYNPEDCTSLYSTAEDVIRVFRTPDMFDDRPRIVRMRGLPADYTKLVSILVCANEKNVLVVDAPLGFYGKNKRFVSAAASNFYKLISTKGSLYRFDIEVKGNATAIAWVKRVSKELGKEIDQDAADLLVMMKGRDLDLLYSELTKLHAFETGKKILVSSVQECCIPAYLRTVWELVDSLDYQRFDDVCVHLQEFHQNAGIETGTSVRGDAEQMLGALQYHYELLLHAKDRCPKALTYDGLIKGVSDIKKLKVPKETKETDDEESDNEPEKPAQEERYGPKFNTQAVGMALHNQAFAAAYNWPKSKIYATLRDIMRCRCRLRSTNFAASGIRLLLDALCLSICGKLTESDMLAVFGYSRRNIRRMIHLAP